MSFAFLFPTGNCCCGNNCPCPFCAAGQMPQEVNVQWANQQWTLNAQCGSTAMPPLCINSNGGFVTVAAGCYWHETFNLTPISYAGGIYDALAIMEVWAYKVRDNQQAGYTFNVFDLRVTLQAQSEKVCSGGIGFPGCIGYYRSTIDQAHQQDYYCCIAAGAAPPTNDCNALNAALVIVEEDTLSRYQGAGGCSDGDIFTNLCGKNSLVGFLFSCACGCPTACLNPGDFGNPDYTNGKSIHFATGATISL